METKHTPAPWEQTMITGEIIAHYPIKYNEPLKPVSRDDASHHRTVTICKVETNLGSNIHTEEQRANLKLIAAAPELAECLAGLMYLGERMEEESGEDDPFVQKCRDTLIKAGINI